MGYHLILLHRGKRELVGECRTELDVSSRPAMRKQLQVFIERDTPEILLVNCAKFKYADFSLFLTLLETPNLHASVWFYGAPLTLYPYTVRSRCDILGKGKATDEITTFLEEHSNLTQANVKSMVYLQKYGLPMAWQMLQAKSNFMTFLVTLNRATVQSFYTLSQRLGDLDVSKEERRMWVYLFFEWLGRCSAFTDDELSLCPWLRTSKFLRQLNRFWGHHTTTSQIDFSEFFFDFILACHLVELV